MFKLAESPQFTHVITVQHPVDGGFDTSTLRVTYRVLGESRFADVNLDERVSSTEFLREVLVGFDDVQDANGQPLPFNDRTRDALIDVPFMRVALAKGYFEAVYKAQLGN
jgi:hypothetical protein